MLRIAVPNKGALAGPTSDLLREAGYRQRGEGRELVLIDPENEVEFFYLRPRDIAVYVGAGTVDAGITGRDLMLDSGVEAVEHRRLGFARSTFRFAAPVGTMASLGDIRGKRVATSYAGVVRDYLRDHDVEATVVRLDGAIESTVHLGVADLVADVVETGATLRAAGLEVFGEKILESEAVLIRPTGEPRAGMEILDRRIKSVQVARQYVMMDYDVPEDLVDVAVSITPGLESPTVSPLHSDGWMAVRAMVDAEQAHRTMDRLYDLGARAILVTSIEACRL
ncbi:MULTISPECIES: ATP phosphoribosyltransferase [unclassified Pseudactinotalea]|uniref:ATP phosphoribosyltransferase n=1 Tax=unclassified Pseudactinotalea TaxID=2649176 RepID=UPI00128BB5EC|nr:MULTISPECIES: ATP phosphoribosyltransferase [unclassified Pseudactinotalea]MPV49317.1 ATP phosphoribosyltransferase [Pseudactinotalea sp. HY160]QGH69389.1 ATP phosphoribosyltransferase [Pseudactinotalea sp. HY158]